MASSHSCECTNTGLDLFTLPPLNTSVESGGWTVAYPLATLSESGPIEFLIKGSGEEYIDLANTYIHVQARVTKPDGLDLTVEDDNLVVPENLFLHTLFSEVDVSLNGVLVSTSSNTYPYRSYIETLLNYGRDAKDTQLASSMFYTSKTSPYPFSADNMTSDVKERKKRIQRSKLIDMMSRLHADIFTQQKYMINNVDVRLRFIRSKNSFALLALPGIDNQSIKDYKIQISQASLFVRKVKVNPSIALAHAKALQTTTCKYPYNKCLVQCFSVPQGNLNIVQDNLFLNQKPSRIVIGLVDSVAFNGSYEQSAFEFKHYNINSLCLYHEGTQIPSKALKPDFDKGAYVRSYLSLFSATGTVWKDAGNCISYEDFAKGFTLFCFDLTPSLVDGDMVEILKTGGIRLEIGFGIPLPNPVHIIVFSETPSRLEISSTRQVIYDN